MALYRFDVAQSRFQVQAFVAGVLSFAGHSPTFAVREYQGSVTLDGDGNQVTSIELAIVATSLQLIDRVSDSDRREIERRMQQEVLESATHREITFRCTDPVAETIGEGRSRLRMNGQLSLHGVTRSHRMAAEFQRADAGIRLTGDTPLFMADYKIKPVTALGGTIKLKDELKVSFDLKGNREGA